ncbi:MAG: hypothetical protein ACKO0W_10620, partial [Planctomycetota bacterium]
MPDDLTGLLASFPYEPGRVVARLVACADGRMVLQVRLELGILQMETTGRPDGGRLLFAEASEAPSGPWSRGFAASVRLEVVQFEQRAVALLAVGEPAAAVADAEEALVRLALLAQRGPADEAEWTHGRRFSVLVLHTRAAAMRGLAEGRGREAAASVEKGLGFLRDAAEAAGIGEAFESLADVVALRALRDSLTPALP